MADELIQFTEVYKVLQDYAQEAVEMYRYQISLGGHNASRALFDSVSTQIKKNGTLFTVTMSLQEYWKFIEGGAQGTEDSPAGAKFPAHFPPISALMNWISVKPVLPRPDANGRMPSPKSLAYLIGRKIKEHGIKPYPALAQTKEELMKIFRDRLVAALNADVQMTARNLVLTQMSSVHQMVTG